MRLPGFREDEDFILAEIKDRNFRLPQIEKKGGQAFTASTLERTWQWPLAHMLSRIMAMPAAEMETMFSFAL